MVYTSQGRRPRRPGGLLRAEPQEQRKRAGGILHLKDSGKATECAGTARAKRERAQLWKAAALALENHQKSALERSSVITQPSSL